MQDLLSTSANQSIASVVVNVNFEGIDIQDISSGIQVMIPPSRNANNTYQVIPFRRLASQLVIKRLLFKSTRFT